MLPVWPRPTVVQDSGRQDPPCSRLTQIPRVCGEEEGPGSAGGRGSRYDPQKAGAILHSAQASPSSGRRARGQRGGADSVVHAGKGHVISHRGPDNSMVPGGCSLVHSGRSTHVSSVCLHCEEGSARVSQT